MQALLKWYEGNGRHDLPWRNTRDQYKVLVSELMLQQTQVARVRPKYEAFIAKYPTIKDLANADRAAVLSMWQGLGYNSRAVRLHALAKLIAAEHGGRLPQSRDELLKLPGIGPYTAGAILIFSKGLPASSVDVNIERVLRRVFWKPAASPARKEVEALQLRLITESGNPHKFHAALMDLGSAVCTAKSPHCASCPLLRQCKTRGVRHDEAKAKQGRFLGSTRWWRGQILKLLLQGPVQHRHLLYKIKQQPDGDDEERCAAALDAMIAEGVVERDGRQLRIVL